MAKALRGEAVVRLPRASNNMGHERLRLARRVKWFDLFSSWWAQQRVPWLTMLNPHLAMELYFTQAFKLFWIGLNGKLL